MFALLLFIGIAVLIWKVLKVWPTVSEQIEQAVAIHSVPVPLPEDRCTEVPCVGNAMG